MRGDAAEAVPHVALDQKRVGARQSSGRQGLSMSDSFSGQPPFKVFLVGAGPGDPELLTRKAYRLLQSANVVLHDELVSPLVLDVIPEQAIKFNVGKRCGKKSFSQDKIHQMMIEYARGGALVVRLKGGDPMIFGRAGEEIAALRTAGIGVEVVPGITASVGAAAAVQVPLTDRTCASTVVVTTTQHASESRRSAGRQAGEPETTLVIYMPGAYQNLAGMLLERGFAESTPCLLVSHACMNSQKTLRTTVANISQTRLLPAPVVLIVGTVVDLYARD